MTCHFEKWWKHCILTGPIFSFFWSQLCAKCDLNSQGVLFSFKVFFPNNLLFISVIRVYYPAGFFFFFPPSLYCGLFLQSIEIFLPSYINKWHLPELVADSAAQPVLPRWLIIKFGSKTGTFTTVVGYQLILPWPQSKMFYIV